MKYGVSNFCEEVERHSSYKSSSGHEQGREDSGWFGYLEIYFVF